MDWRLEEKDRGLVALLFLLFLFGFSFVIGGHFSPVDLTNGPQTAAVKTPTHNVETISTPTLNPGPAVTPVAQTYYVSPNGNDTGNGTPTNPWRTIQKAANTAAPGDTVYVRVGVYGPYNNGNDVAVFTRSGTANAPIIFKNYPGETPVIEARLNGARKDRGFYINQADHLIISGFEVRGARRAGIRVTGGDYVTLEDNKIHDIRETSSVNILTPAIGITNGFSRGNIVRRNEIYDSSYGIVIRNDGGDPIEDPVIEKNYIHDIHWYGVDGAFNDKNADGLVFNHTLRPTARQNIIARTGDDGIDCYYSYQGRLEKNTIFNIGDVLSGTPSNANGDGNGIKVSTGGGGGHTVTRTLVLNVERVAFDQDHVSTTAPGNNFYHNVAYGSGRNGFLFERTSATPNFLRNNIAFANNQDAGDFTDIRVSDSISTVIFDSDFNLWSDGHMPAGLGGSEGNHSLSGNPLFINPPPAGVGLTPEILGLELDSTSPHFGEIPGFYLQNNSPAIDAGENLDNRYTGNGADLGAYESF